MIEDLTQELMTLVRSAPSIQQRAYSVFNADEMETYRGVISFPYCGVTWEGCAPKDTINSATGNPSKSASAVIVTAYYSVILAIMYKDAATADTKHTATDLLDEIRNIVLGYKGINYRPWRWTGDAPMPDEYEGVILYGQTWETDFIAKGNTP